MPDTSDIAYDAYVQDAPPHAGELRGLFNPRRVRILFDIGACEGEDSLRYARLFPNARIFSFEPLPANQRSIRRHFQRHEASRCELVPLALSDKNGTARFHVSSGEPSHKFHGEDWNYGNKSSSLLPPKSRDPMHGWIEFKEEIEVPTQTLAAFCASRGIGKIDFIHMDVQGAELLVLKGAEGMLPGISAVWLEVSDQALYEGQPLRPEIRRFMGARGFALANESMNGIEGDHLYVNLRSPRCLLYFLQSRFSHLLARARFKAGGWKSRLLKRRTLL